jgi:MazG family protein
VKQLKQFETLVRIMDRLRGPDGCPWDHEQTYESLRSYLIEECYEVADAIDRDDPEDLCEELGDLLFQIVFLARLAKEDKRFTTDQVIEGISQKMIRRHPHVFGDESVSTSEEVLKNWEAIKAEEKREAVGRGKIVERPQSVIDGIPPALPALLKAQRLGTKAARVGFDWERPEQVIDKIDEEFGELQQAMERQDRDGAREELGDLLFSVVMLARKLEIDPEGALEQTNLKFGRRFRWIERRLADDDRTIERTPSDRLEELWEQSKDRVEEA